MALRERGPRVVGPRARGPCTRGPVRVVPCAWSRGRACVRVFALTVGYRLVCAGVHGAAVCHAVYPPKAQRGASTMSIRPKSTKKGTCLRARPTSRRLTQGRPFATGRSARITARPARMASIKIGRPSSELELERHPSQPPSLPVHAARPMA